MRNYKVVLVATTTVLAVLSYHIAEAFLFGVTVQNPAGTTIAGANPTQTSSLLGLGFLTAALGTAFASLLGVGRTPATTTVIQGGRRKRQIANVNEILGEDDIQLINVVLEQLDATDCFQRMLCDMAATSDGSKEFSQTANNIMKFVHLSEKVPMTSLMAEKGLSMLNKSILLGQRVKKEEICETVYNNCPMSGQQMDKAFSVFGPKY